MAGSANILRLDHLTHKGNRKDTRYGWLRLTPAFSLHLVRDYVQRLSSTAKVLDPFCGTGTTALVCAEEGIYCETTDINPFLLWLAEAKCFTYSSKDVELAHSVADRVSKTVRERVAHPSWVPSLHQIEKWWEPHIVKELGTIKSVISEQEPKVGSPASWLLKLAFCRTMIEVSKVSFGHQSMSFKQAGPTLLLDFKSDHNGMTLAKWTASTASIFKAAQTEISVLPRFVKCDARRLGETLSRESFDCVITSPPYPNRMSYIRELRPYMYWLGYLDNGRDAGELDWQAIGGTWGVATSNLTKWEPPKDIRIPYKGFDTILSKIAETSPLLSQYVRKYFYDMVMHTDELFKVVKPGGVVQYIVGNSKFYDVMLPVEEIFASLFSCAGFEQTKIDVIRKRTSKKELFEYVVSATKPS